VGCRVEWDFEVGVVVKGGIFCKDSVSESEGRVGLGCKHARVK